MRKVLFLIILMNLFINSAISSVETFEESDNKGLNKAERIGLIEKHLVKLTQEVKDLESINKENAKLNKEMEAVIKKYKEQEQKMSTENDENSVAQKITDDNLKINEELKKIKEDIMSLKNQDIDQLQELVNAFRFRLDNLEKTLKIPLRP